MSELRRGRVVCSGAGVGGVAVSNGLHVMRTDSDGRFSLPEHGPFIWLTRPTDYEATPWFLPADSPDLTFELRPRPHPVPFSFVQITDLHLSLGDTTFGPDGGDDTFWFDGQGFRERIVTTPAVLQGLFAELAARAPQPAFVLATGDLTNTGAVPEYDAWCDAVARAGVPVVSMPGNHDHMALPGDPAAVSQWWYERALGPRWFSFDYGGVHFACIDWYSHLREFDDEVQEAWLAADVAMVPDTTPVIVCSHDLMKKEFYERLARAPIATFSGHWHTTRVVRAGSTIHYNTGSATFGGLDYSPAHYRVATWDGEALDVRTIARGPRHTEGATFRPAPARANGALWSRALAGAVHLASPVTAGDAVIAVSKLEDEPRGFLEAFNVADGEPRWTVSLDSAVKCSPVVVGDAVIAVSVAGETVCVDLASGAERWRTRICDDDTLLWTYLRPATDGHRVFVGDVARFVALAVADGSVAWARDDLGRRENMTSHAHPVVTNGRLLVSFAAQVPDLWALDPRTGRTLWPDEPNPRSIYACGPEELAQHLVRTPMASPTADPDGEDFYLVRLGSRIERMRAADGAVVWSAPLLGWFNPAPPVVHGERILIGIGSGELWCLDRATGDLQWRTALTDAAPIAMGAYRDTGGCVLGRPEVVGGHALVALGDGRLVAVRLEDGEIGGSLDVGVPLGAGPIADRDRVVVAGTDGVLGAFAVASILERRDPWSSARDVRRGRT